jgi:hypothetical protein
MQDTVSSTLYPIRDEYLKSLKENFFSKSQKQVKSEDFKALANEWFQSSKLNSLHGWKAFPHIDIMLGCTHFIEATCLRYGWKIQHIPNEYSYYALNGKRHTEIDKLQENVPLIISLPTWQYCDVHPRWEQILQICEDRNIKIHIDGAWFQSARNIEFDFDHPNIESFGMSIGKGIDLQWNRIGIRWSRQKSIDSITIMNQYDQIQHTAITCGAYVMNNVEKDYAWNKYANANEKIAKDKQLQQTNSCHVLKDKENKLWGIGLLVANV